MQGLEIAGRTDRWIVEQLLERDGKPNGAEEVARFLDVYVELLAEELPKRNGGLHPGVLGILEEAHQRPELVQALLTGNIGKFFEFVRGKTGRVDLLLHSVAFAPKEALEGNFLDTSREAFRIAHDISAYSLVAVSRAAVPLMNAGGSIVTMSYYGAAKVVPHYNVMGVAKAALEASVRYLAYDLGPKKIRVNAISAGPVNTLAARGISGFSAMLSHYEAHAPLKRNITLEELGATGVFLASDGAAGITGQILYADSGYSVMGM